MGNVERTLLLLLACAPAHVRSAGFHCRANMAADASLPANQLWRVDGVRSAMVCSQHCDAAGDTCVAASYYHDGGQCSLHDTLDHVRMAGAKLCTRLPHEPGKIALDPSVGGGKIHVFGAHQVNAAKVAHQIFDPFADGGNGASWVVQHGANELPVVGLHYATMIGCCKVYIIGGKANSADNLHVYVYNLLTGAVSTDVPLAAGRDTFYGVTYAERIYICAGKTAGSYNNTCFVYVPGGGELAEEHARVFAGGAAAGRSLGQAAQVDGTFYYIGGHTSNGYSHVHAYATDEHMVQWRRLANLPHRTFVGAAVGSPLGAVYYCAGKKANPTQTPEQAIQRWCRRYNPVVDQWMAITEHPRNRQYGDMVALFGKLYLLGGKSQIHSTDSAQWLVESYDVAADAWSSPNTAGNRIAYAALYTAAVAVEN